MSRKAITIHVLTAESGVSFFWELHTVAGRLIADSISEGEIGCFGTATAAFADAAKIAAVYMEHAAATSV